jgi:hypothetical protein
MVRPLKQLPERQIEAMIVRLRSRRNRYLIKFWRIARQTPEGQKLWQQIMAIDREINKWGSRLK